MGGADKGLQSFNGMPLALHAMTRLQMGGSVGTIMINANRNLAAYESFGAQVWPDVLADYAGPLAGFLTGLERCETPYLVTVPCDTPLLPLDLVPRLWEALLTAEADIAMAAAPEIGLDGSSSIRAQPVFCLLRVSLLESLVSFTHQGGRKIDAWTGQHKTALAIFDRPGDDPQAFFNTNTLGELHALERRPT
jgi:molybdopterin-guanine dinucleotide biosynthesis protein A